MAKERKNEAIWLNTESRWLMQIQINGKRKKFYSSQKGKRGKIEAERKADDWLERNTFIENTKVQDMFDDFIAEMKDQDMEYRQFESIGKIWIKPNIGKKRFVNLTDSDFQDILNSAYKKGLSKKTIQNIRGCCTRFLKYCRQHGATTLRPELEVNKKAVEGEKRSLEDDEIIKFFTCDYAKRRGEVCIDWYRYMYRFAISTGLRPSEICGLSVEDVQDDGYITVRRGINSRGEVTQGKNDNARRTFKLNSVASSVLSDQLEMLSNATFDKKWLFPRENGDPTSEQYYYRRFKIYCKYNGIENITPYEMRHTYVSINKEMPDELLKLQVGHSKAMPTREQYSHERKGDAELAADISSKVLEKIIQENDPTEAES